MVSVYRQGDCGRNWYAVLSGSLDVNVHEQMEEKVGVDCERGMREFVFRIIIMLLLNLSK